MPKLPLAHKYLILAIIGLLIPVFLLASSSAREAMGSLDFFESLTVFFLRQYESHETALRWELFAFLTVPTCIVTIAAICDTVLQRAGYALLSMLIGLAFGLPLCVHVNGLPETTKPVNGVVCLLLTVFSCGLGLAVPSSDDVKAAANVWFFAFLACALAYKFVPWKTQLVGYHAFLILAAANAVVAVALFFRRFSVDNFSWYTHEYSAFTAGTIVDFFVVSATLAFMVHEKDDRRWLSVVTFFFPFVGFPIHLAARAKPGFVKL